MAIAQYIDEDKVIVPLEKEERRLLENLAKKHNRPKEYEGREAIAQYLTEQKLNIQS